ncbi:hypothetical protein KZ829_30490 [Actinoplanes hulinensis]|uniref:Uncharacterized protein n=1 Tax=Actinoplanes hulinensis TaxID=1144547 RepID=A0ABS7BBN9_9ACTN|nr:hypothetical protein [Actinoplanes hulinensis]MBW6438066.1 hypothetical protein [Actinoplanes hulinensis]
MTGRIADTLATMDFNATRITPVINEANMEHLIRAAHRRLVDWRQPVGGRETYKNFDLLAR